MENSKIKKSGAIVIVAIMIIMLLSIVLEIGAKKLYKLNINNNIIYFFANRAEEELENEVRRKLIAVNWQKEYPFEVKNESEKSVTQPTELGLLEKIKTKFNVVKTKINNLEVKFNNIKLKCEDLSSKDLIGYNKLLEGSYIYDKIINYSLVPNNSEKSRINLYDYWCRLAVEKDTKKPASQLIDFNEFLKEKNINLLYVQEPSKIENNNDYVSKIYNDNIALNSNNLLKNIKGKVNYLDLRQKINKNSTEYLNLFFKTDHHWRPETGVWAAGEISKELNSKYNYNIASNILDINNYNIKVYENSYLGSDGRYVTLANCSSEDISIITPKFDTELTVKIPDEVPYAKGSFEKTLIDYTVLDYKNDYCRYNAYVYGNKALIEVHNEKIHDGSKVLLVKDSFGCVVAPYLSLGVEYCSMIDLRMFTGSLKTYINKYNPDTVIVLYYEGMLLDENAMVWDFE